MGEQLQALFAQHKTAALATAGAGVVALALYQRKKAGTGAATSQPAGTIPAAAVIPSQPVASTYDSSAFDAYSALQPEIDYLAQQEQGRQTGASGSGITAAPAPVASTLFAPSGSGNYIDLPNGVYGEVEPDGSVFGMTYDQYQKLGSPTLTQLNKNVPFSSTEGNILAAQKAATAGT